MTTCKLCPEPGVTYQRNGKTFQRYYCAAHWSAFMADWRQEQRQKAGVPDGWKLCRKHWLKPPEGVTRIVLDGYRNRVTVYRGDIMRTTQLRTLKRLNTLPKLREFYTAIGYEATDDRARWCVLKRDAVPSAASAPGRDVRPTSA